MITIKTRTISGGEISIEQELNLPQKSNLTSAEGGFKLSEIQIILNLFTDCYKLPFEMYLQGWQYKEIAQELGLKISTVKSRIFFTQKRVQELLIEDNVNKTP